MFDTVNHWKALSSDKVESRLLSCGSTLNICQGVLKSANLLHKSGFNSFPMTSTVHRAYVIGGCIFFWLAVYHVMGEKFIKIPSDEHSQLSISIC